MRARMVTRTADPVQGWRALVRKVGVGALGVSMSEDDERGGEMSGDYSSCHGGMTS